MIHGGDSQSQAPISFGSDALAVSALDTVDLDADFVDDIVIGTACGWVRRVDPDTVAATDLAGPFAGEIFGLNVKDVTGDRVVDYVFTAEGRVHVVSGACGTEEWLSDYPAIGPATSTACWSTTSTVAA